MMKIDSVKKFFKYSDVDGVRYILRDGTLKFSQASEFNDPFDTSIQALFGYDPIECLQELREEHVKVLLSDEIFPSFSKIMNAQLTEWMRTNLSAKTKEEKEYISKLILADSSESIWNLEKMRIVHKETLATIKLAFSADAIFCASQNYDNQLLWAHYAENHKGAALEFVTNIEKDSIFRLLTKVCYSDERPILHKTPKDFLYKSLFHEDSKIIEEYAHSLIFTKNLSWEYEQEVRCFIPSYICGGLPYRLQNYHNDELRAVYLGCKMDENAEKEIIGLAVARNPDVKIFRMRMDSNSYNLTSDRITQPDPATSAG